MRLSGAAIWPPLMINSVSRAGHRQILLATFSRPNTAFPQLISPFQGTRRRNSGLTRRRRSRLGRRMISRNRDYPGHAGDRRAQARAHRPIGRRAEGLMAVRSAATLDWLWLEKRHSDPVRGGWRRQDDPRHGPCPVRRDGGPRRNQPRAGTLVDHENRGTRRQAAYRALPHVLAARWRRMRLIHYPRDGKAYR